MKLQNQYQSRIYFFVIYSWFTIFSSSLDALLKLSKTTSRGKLFPSDCITLHVPVEMHEVGLLVAEEVDEGLALHVREGDLDAGPG